MRLWGVRFVSIVQDTNVLHLPSASPAPLQHGLCSLPFDIPVALDTPLLDFLVELQVLCVSTTALLYARTTLRFCRCFALFQSPKGLTVVVTTKSLRSSNSNTAADAKTRCAEFHVSPLTSKKTAP